jgi:uncharacterized protein YxjI
VAQDPFGFDRYLVEQLFRPVVNLYRVTPLAAGETPAGGPVAFVRQKRMALKEDIRFFADEEETRELFRIKARRMLEVGGRYDVTDAEGGPVGVLEHQFGRSLFRSTWRLFGAEESAEPLAVAQERSLFLAILRRAIDFVPYVGEWIPVPYNFEIRAGDRVIGGIDRKFQLRDRYVLDVSGDHERLVDRRLGIALAIGLDTLQNR